MPTTKRPPSRKRSVSLKEANARLVRDNKQLRRERDQGVEQQAATSAILRMIASSPMVIQPGVGRDGRIRRSTLWRRRRGDRAHRREVPYALLLISARFVWRVS